MILTGFDLYQYRLPLAEAITLKGERFLEREGVLVRLKTDTGAMGWGEVAPLPQFSRESLSEAAQQLLDLRNMLQGWAITPDWIEPEGLFIHFMNEQKLAASVRFGVELAIWSLYAAARKTSLPRLITPHPRGRVFLNGLLAGTPEDVLDTAQRMREAGYRAVKLKVGRRDVIEDIDLVRKVSRVLGGAVALRLDANRAWRRDEAAAFLKGIAGIAIEYIEEPLITPESLPELVEQYDVPVALDESLIGLPVEALGGYGFATAVVLKPMLLGGLIQTLRVAHRATDLGMNPVLSATYETGIGLRSLIAIAASIGNEAVPAGLDTYRWLAEDVIEPRLEIQHAHVDVAAVLNMRYAIKRAMLQPLEDRR